MIDLALDENHDLAFVDGDLVLVRDRLEVLQNVKIRLLFIQTEWAYDFTIGVPWMTRMFDIQTPKVQRDAWLKDTIIQTVGVGVLTDFESSIDRENNGAFVAFKAQTIYGPIEGGFTV